ncbi:sterile alpha motif domain-containing protein 3, partial [Tachysurus ichikawai]
MSNLEEIKLAISSSLPGLSAIETKDDLRYVKEEDLMEFLRPIQCRKLLNAWKN